MENKQNYYSNFKCYDRKGRRLSIFGEVIEGKLRIYQISCSKKDKFTKFFAKRAYYWYNQKVETGTYEDAFLKTIHPTVTILDIKNDKPLFMFNQHCKENYYHKQTITCLYNVEMLKKGFEIKIVNVTKKKVKI